MRHDRVLPCCRRNMYLADEHRYRDMGYRRCGASGLLLPPISLGLWHNFGDTSPLNDVRAIVRRAFDLGVTHFDLANNYGPPYGAAEANFGRIFREDLAPYRDELVISTKAGYDMWPGPYGDGGSRKYLLASLDQSLQRMGLDYVDIFYSHRFDPGYTARGDDGGHRQRRSAGQSAVRRDLLLPAGGHAQSCGDPHQDGHALAYSPALVLVVQSLDRARSSSTFWEEAGVGCIAFSPPRRDCSRRSTWTASRRGRERAGPLLRRDSITESRLAQVRALDAIASRRGQSLAQMAIAWVLRTGVSPPPSWVSAALPSSRRTSAH